MTPTGTLEDSLSKSTAHTPKTIIKQPNGHLLQNIDLAIGMCDLFIPTQAFGKRTTPKKDFQEWWDYDQDGVTVASIETFYAIMHHIFSTRKATGETFPDLTQQNKSFLWQQTPTLASRILYDGVFGTIEHKNPDGSTHSVVTPIPEYTPLSAIYREDSPRRTTKLMLVRSTSDRAYLCESIADATEQLLQATLGKNHDEYIEALRTGVHNLGADINLLTPELRSRDPNTHYRLSITRRSPTVQIDIGFEMPTTPDKYSYLVRLDN